MNRNRELVRTDFISGALGTAGLWIATVSSGPLALAGLFVTGCGGYIALDAWKTAKREAEKWSQTVRAMTVAGCGFFATAAGTMFEDGSITETAIMGAGVATCIAGLGTAVVIQCRR